MSTALVLAGHGSHISANTADTVWRQVDRLRAMHAADEITAAFWKEMPAFSQVLNTLAATDVTVVPLFTAPGFFTRQVIPAEMRLHTDAVDAGADGRRVRCTEPVGMHPLFSEITRQRIVQAMESQNLRGSQVAAVIIGHSTRRNPDSRRVVELQVEKLRASPLVAEVCAVYLDDEPSIREAYALTACPVIIAVPFFLAAGSHTTIDVPAELGLEPGEQTGIVQGRKVFYTPPVGIEDSLTQVILELAYGADRATAFTENGSAWDCFPQIGQDELIRAVQTHGVLHFGELRLTPAEVRPIQGEPEQVVTDPGTLRRIVRGQGELFRPLASAASLPAGWRVEISTPQQIHAVVETVYPGAVAAWSRARHGTLPITTLAHTIERQVGMFSDLNRLTPEQIAGVTEACCTTCLYTPVWTDPAAVETKQTRCATDDTLTADLPCPEACNLWLSEAARRFVQDDANRSTTKEPVI